MRILAGQDEDSQRNLQLSNGIKVGYLQQEPKLDMEATVLGNIEPALASTKSMLSEFEEVRISELFRHRNGPFIKQHLNWVCLGRLVLSVMSWALVAWAWVASGWKHCLQTNS